MKKIFIILFYLLLFSTFIFPKNFICYYIPNPDYHNFKTNCELVAGYFKNKGYDIEYEELSTKSIDKSLKEYHDAVMFSSHGYEKGMLVENFDTGKKYNVKWSLFKKMKTSILIVSACYSGNIFLNNDFISQNPYIIVTSSTPNAATYRFAINHIYTNSFAMTFACLFDKNFDCPVDYKECQPGEDNDFGACQFKLSLEYFARRRMMTNDKFDKDKFNEYTFSTHYASIAMGIAMINGNVIRHIDLEKYR